MFTYDERDYLTGQDVYSNYPVVELFANKSQKQIERAFNKIVKTFGLPMKILTDRGVEFNSLRAPHTRTSAFHPQGNGKPESFHRDLQQECCIRDILLDEPVHYMHTDLMMTKFFTRRNIEEAKQESLEEKAAVKIQESPAKFTVGDVVLRHVHRRLRSKFEDVWSSPYSLLDRMYLLIC